MEREYHPRAPEKTSQLMSNVRSANTAAERLLRSQLHRLGLRFRKNAREFLGRPDVLFPKRRVAVFVDGDYWHGRIFTESGLDALKASLKTANRDFWIRKILQNVKRDAFVTSELQRQGWCVIRVWETDVKRDAAAVAHRVFRVLEGTTNTRHSEMGTGLSANPADDGELGRSNLL